MSSAALLKKYRPKSNRDPEIGSPSINIRGSSRCHPRGLSLGRRPSCIKEGDIPYEENSGLLNKLVLLSIAREVDFSSYHQRPST
jgi:hypothetical protein